jgi:adenylate kinase family enzyme
MARELSEICGLPLVHLDKLYWTGHWCARTHEEFDALLINELEKEEWILDGTMRRTLPLRLNYCDTVIYLDFSGIRCFFGTFSRVIKNRGRVRADMGGKCIERLDRRSLSFVFGTLKFNKKNRGYIYSHLSGHKDVNVIVLKNRRQVRKYLDSLKEEIKNGYEAN